MSDSVNSLMPLNGSIANTQQTSSISPIKNKPKAALQKKVNFSDTLLFHSAMRAQGVSLCSFLIALAAFQRGLSVTFHYEVMDTDFKYGKESHQGRGTLFTVSDGINHFTFDRTVTKSTSVEATQISIDKHLTKKTLQKAGVCIPKGIVVLPGQLTLVKKFLHKSPGKLFVIKPVFGSKGAHVYTHLSAEQVLSSIKKLPPAKFLVEEFIEGTEVRAFVIDGQCIAIASRISPRIEGDGVSSIKTLMDKKNLRRQANPHLITRPFNGWEETLALLQEQGYSFSSVPKKGEVIILSHTANFSLGAESIDRTAELMDVVGPVAVKACQAIDLILGGVDIILSETPQGQHEVNVLEVNSRPHIGSHTFPFWGHGQGNAVAEAIIDFYFPQTQHWRRNTYITFDFKAIKDALSSSSIAEISLPRLDERYTTFRFQLQDQQWIETVTLAAKKSGMYLMTAAQKNGATLFSLSYTVRNLSLFLQLIPEKMVNQFVKLDKEHRLTSG